MKFRIRLDLILNSDKETLANNVYDTLLNNLRDHAQIINEGLDNEETSKMQLEKCYHDEPDTPDRKPCETLKEVHK